MARPIKTAALKPVLGPVAASGRDRQAANRGPTEDATSQVIRLLEQEGRHLGVPTDALGSLRISPAAGGDSWLRPRSATS